MQFINQLNLDGRVAVVTGVAGALGGRVASYLDELGARVIGIARDVSRCMTASWLERGSVIEADIRDVSAMDQAVAQIVAQHPQVHVLVNSAGIGGRSSALDYPRELWARVLDTNLTAPFALIQRLGPHLHEGTGSIVNVSSIGGVVGFAGSVGYQASKAGLNQMTRTLAVEWAPREIRVNAVAPSQFETAQVREQWKREPELAAAFRSRTPLRGIATVDSVASAVAFLATDAASMITGHCLMVDGGYTAQ